MKKYIIVKNLDIYDGYHGQLVHIMGFITVDDNKEYNISDDNGNEWFVSLDELNEVNNVSETDCRTETGITVGLIDAIITQCRVLKGRDLKKMEVKEALKDLFGDDDFNLLLNEYVNILRTGQLNS